MIHFLATGYVSRDREGPLSITYIDDESIHVVAALTGHSEIRRQIRAGIPIADIVAGLKRGKHTHTLFPIKSLESVTWNDYQHDVVFRYEDGMNIRKAKTHIRSSGKRTGMLEVLQNCFPRPFRYEEEPAGWFRAAWANLLGAVVSLAGTIFIQAMWDPAKFAQMKDGWIALLLGRVGCVFVGMLFFFGCCYYGYKAMEKRPMVYRCLLL